MEHAQRFEHWKPPLIQEGKLTKWSWMVQHKNRLVLGYKTDIGAFCYLNAKNGITIEDGVQIGSHCAIYSVSTIDGKEGRVTLKKGCCLGSHCTVMPGVTIGEYAVVGAHSFVNRDIPANTVSFGVPARVHVQKTLVKRKVLVVTASRAERGLLEPVMVELEKREDVNARWCLLNPDYLCVNNVAVVLDEFKPDIVLVPCDRHEMVYVATYASNHGFTVAQFHAGDSGEGTTDEMNRYAISFLSHIFFCNSELSRTNLLNVGIEDKRVFVVGTTALDHVDIDESLCPNSPYCLVLLHPDPVSSEATKQDLQNTIVAVSHCNLLPVWFKPNNDNNHEIIDSYIDTLANVTVYDHVPRSQFLGLLKKCGYAIGNSSSFTLELPLVNSQACLVRIGSRNKDRTPPKIQVGASKRIAEVLATINLDDDFRRKKIVFKNG